MGTHGLASPSIMVSLMLLLKALTITHVALRITAAKSMVTNPFMEQKVVFKD